MWGCNSPKGFDCSGFTKTVFFLNGIDLMRDSSQQAGQGVEVPLDGDLSQLKKGDLLFFGPSARRGKPEKVVHVGIYLGEQALHPLLRNGAYQQPRSESPIRDENRIRTLLRARRVLPSQ